MAPLTKKQFWLLNVNFYVWEKVSRVWQTWLASTISRTYLICSTRVSSGSRQASVWSKALKHKKSYCQDFLSRPCNVIIASHKELNRLPTLLMWNAFYQQKVTKFASFSTLRFSGNFQMVQNAKHFWTWIMQNSQNLTESEKNRKNLFIF